MNKTYDIKRAKNCINCNYIDNNYNGHVISYIDNNSHADHITNAQSAISSSTNNNYNKNNDNILKRNKNQFNGEINPQRSFYCAVNGNDKRIKRGSRRSKGRRKPQAIKSKATFVMIATKTAPTAVTTAITTANYVTLTSSTDAAVVAVLLNLFILNVTLLTEATTIAIPSSAAVAPPASATSLTSPAEVVATGNAAIERVIYGNADSAMIYFPATAKTTGNYDKIGNNNNSIAAFNDNYNSNNNKNYTKNNEYDDDYYNLTIIETNEYIFDNNYVRILFIVLYTVCFCCCVFGNLLVILVVTCSRRLRSITNFFLANLAVADFCVGVFCVMQNLSIYLIDSWVFGDFLCRMYQFVHSLSYTASIFILVVICTERYFAIVHPITCKQILTAARLRLVIVTVWITAAVYSTPKFVFSKTIENVHDDDGHAEEICVLDRKMFSSKLLDMINFVLLYAIPLMVMTVLYSKIAITLWRSSRGWSQHIAHQQQHDNGLGLHNSMYQHHQQYQNHQPHQQLQQNSNGSTPPLARTSRSFLSRRQGSKYEKRGVSITESQEDSFEVSLQSNRPVVSALRNKGSFYYHGHHHRHQQNHQHPNQQNHHQLHQQDHHNHYHRVQQQLQGQQQQHQQYQQYPQRRPSVQRGISHMTHSSSNVLRARRGVVRMLIIFVLTFAICNLPIHARKMWQYWGRSYRGDSNFNALLTPLTFLCSYLNSAVNPLLYAFLSRNFRKGMKELLSCSWKKNKSKCSMNSSMHQKRIALQTHSLPTDTTHVGNEQL